MSQLQLAWVTKRPPLISQFPLWLESTTSLLLKVVLGLCQPAAAALRCSADLQKRPAAMTALGATSHLTF